MNTTTFAAQFEDLAKVRIPYTENGEENGTEHP